MKEILLETIIKQDGNVCLIQLRDRVFILVLLLVVILPINAYSQKFENELKIFSLQSMIDNYQDSASIFITRKNSITYLRNDYLLNRFRRSLKNLSKIEVKKNNSVIIAVAILSYDNCQDTISLYTDINIVKINNQYYNTSNSLLEIIIRYIPIADSYFMEGRKRYEE